MKKETLELKREKKHIKGYGKLIPDPYTNKDSNAILDKLVEWSQGKNITIYSHNSYTQEENVGEDGIYAYFRYGQKITKEEFEADDEAYSVPYCDLVYYLDIYYQEK